MANESAKPRQSTIMWSLIVLGIYTVMISVASRLPTSVMRMVFIPASSLLMIPLAWLVSIDFIYPGGLKYKKNLGNTVSTVLITIPLMTILYSLVWYPNLNREVLQLSEDVVSQTNFPAVALFQRNDWSSQANLLGGLSKCFLGWYNDTSPMCNYLPPEQINPGSSCNCNDSWSPQVGENFLWQGTSYRFLSFAPSPKLIDHTPTYTLLLQAFFNYNVTRALKASSQQPNPTLWLALYDPILTLTEALEKSYTRMVLINANAISSINLRLVYRKAEGFAPAHDYDLSISSSPNMNLVCNTDDPKSYPCYITLLIQIPSFGRTIVSQRMAMGWVDAAASAGACFSFVQVLSWVFSGLASG